jgi:hypothetical protein
MLTLNQCSKIILNAVSCNGVGAFFTISTISSKSCFSLLSIESPRFMLYEFRLTKKVSGVGRIVANVLWIVWPASHSLTEVSLHSNFAFEV